MKMNLKRKPLFIIVLLMVIGYASISTSLYINGFTEVAHNPNDFNVYFSNAYVNGVQDISVVTSDITIDFSTEFSELGEQYVLDYEVTNGSRNYDAEVDMICNAGNQYLTIRNDFDTETILEARHKRKGKLTLELSTSYTGDDMNMSIQCILDVNALERTSLGEDLGTNAEDIGYIDTFGMNCDNVQCAIEELNKLVDEVY